LHDLKNTRLALTDKLSTSGYLVPRVMLENLNINDPNNFFEQIVLTGSHDRSIDALLEGAVDVAAVGDFFVKLLPEEKKDKIQIIGSSKPIPIGPITIQKNLSKDIKEKLYAAFLEIDKEMPKNILKVTEIDRFIPQKMNILKK